MVCPTTPVPQGDEVAWWVAQMILSVPLAALLIYEFIVLLLGALPQTLVDGSGTSTGGQQSYVGVLRFDSSRNIVYGVLAILSTLVILPIAPFVYNMYGRFNCLVIVIFVAATLYCVSTYPFTQVAPM